MIIKFDYNNFLIMDGEKLLSISHHFFPVFTCKNRIMLSDEPEDEGSRNKEVSRADPRHPNKTSDSRSIHRNESGLRQHNDVSPFLLSFRSITMYTGTCTYPNDRSHRAIKTRGPTKGSAGMCTVGLTKVRVG